MGIGAAVSRESVKDRQIELLTNFLNWCGC